MKKYYLLIMLFTLVGCTPVQQEKEIWGYEETNGPDTWANLDEKYLTCEEGQIQSPINIEDNMALLQPSALTKINYSNTEFKVKNNGHTIEFEDESKTNTVTYNNKIYTLSQMHFHSDSEHEINKKSYPLELHLVHSNQQGEKLVIAVMLDIGQENDFISDNFTKNDETFNSNPSILLPDDTNDYYSYEGSLTTPPCTEQVSWIVLKNKMTISKEQLQQFNQKYDKNSRPIQKNSNQVYKTK